ncbi:MAG TPA: hypothetical protein VH253_00350 [Phycisphaerae bacterium]|nr:hypothetical protein [Phycisphaerae bacterium]
MPEIVFLSIDDVLLVHDEMFQRFGGERAGTASAIVFLARNGWLVDASDEEIETVAVRVADVTRDDHLPEEELAEWFREHVTPIDPSRD